MEMFLGIVRPNKASASKKNKPQPEVMISNTKTEEDWNLWRGAQSNHSPSNGNIGNVSVTKHSAKPIASALRDRELHSMIDHSYQIVVMGLKKSERERLDV